MAETWTGGAIRDLLGLKQHNDMLRTYLGQGLEVNLKEQDHNHTRPKAQ